ncbi:N-glycosidase YbiA [termite gut metagenome]|uniref:N-glycosidase YbiA n=1 Tax=termite gut metagenome TaxID=433724 RepID=A0A5J4QL29_9ZZZZ
MDEIRTYNVSECCVFRKTKELFGGLSNMASGFPLTVNGIHILSSEALYQACRFPHLPEVQKKIFFEKSPMSAKMVGKPYRNDSRPDWENARIKIMRWCLRVKLAQHFIEFGKLLESTYDKHIVEDSSKDNYWGAIRNKQDGNILKGINALGRLLMELRKFYNEKRFSHEMFVIEPLNISDFKLFGQPIDIIDERENLILFIKTSIRYNLIEGSNILTSQHNSSIIAEKAIVEETEKSLFKPTEKKKTSKKAATTKGRSKKCEDKYEEDPTLPLW